MRKRQKKGTSSDSVLEIKIKEYGEVIFKSRCLLRDEKKLSIIFHTLRDKFNLPVYKEDKDRWFE